MFDDEAIWYANLNDPTTNLNFGAVFSFIKEGNKNAEAVNVGLIEKSLPPKFLRIQ